MTNQEKFEQVFKETIRPVSDTDKNACEIVSDGIVWLAEDWLNKPYKE